MTFMEWFLNSLESGFELPLLLFSLSLLFDVATSAKHHMRGLVAFLSTSLATSFDWILLGLEALTSEMTLPEECETLR